MRRRGRDDDNDPLFTMWRGDGWRCGDVPDLWRGESGESDRAEHARIAVAVGQ
jgi:hypothetical protein